MARLIQLPPPPGSGPAAPWLDDPAELLDRVRPDAVIIATLPNQLAPGARPAVLRARPALPDREAGHRGLGRRPWRWWRPCGARACSTPGVTTGATWHRCRPPGNAPSEGAIGDLVAAPWCGPRASPIPTSTWSLRRARRRAAADQRHPRGRHAAPPVWRGRAGAGRQEPCAARLPVEDNTAAAIPVFASGCVPRWSAPTLACRPGPSSRHAGERGLRLHARERLPHRGQPRQPGAAGCCASGAHARRARKLLRGQAADAPVPWAVAGTTSTRPSWRTCSVSWRAGEAPHQRGRRVPMTLAIGQADGAAVRRRRSCCRIAAACHRRVGTAVWHRAINHALTTQDWRTRRLAPAAERIWAA